MTDSARGVYGIAVAAELTGVGEQTLRLYEKKGLLTPDRTPGGTRRYSDDDVNQVRRIAGLVLEGHNLSGARRILELLNASDRAVPNLPSRNFDETAAFYGAFGFETTYRDAGWMILARATVQLEFFPFPELDPLTSSFRCSIRVADLDELYAGIRAAGVRVGDSGIPRLTPAAVQSWGQRAAFLVDPNGTLLNLIEERG